MALWLSLAFACSASAGATEPAPVAGVPESSGGRTAESPKVAREAVVIRVASNSGEASSWKARWARILLTYDELIQSPEAYPSILRGEELGLPPGSYAVVAGICEPTEAARFLTVVQSIYPDAMVKDIRETTPLACPNLRTRAKVHTHKSLASNGWRLAFNVYLSQPMGADGYAQRKEPPAPDSGYLKVIATLFDPDGNLKRREKDSYAYFPDLISQPPDVCKLKFTERPDRIIVNAVCDSEPMPCSGNVWHWVEKVTYRIVGNSLEVKRKVVEKKTEPLCD
ncbi:hypothetical protein JGU66_07600 [Myxococcaceae bacterium JPH2]|nr:hypothetical protein [Myxococcaceae bacterium JPH2]